MKISHALIIEKLGGVTAVANRLGIKPPSVSGWIAEQKNSIPEGRLIELGAEIEKVTPYRRWHLRPDDWFVIWPELIGTPGAPRLVAGAAEKKASSAWTAVHGTATGAPRSPRLPREGPSAQRERTRRQGAPR
jgi:DNA-binding transcriptional regulator YdaS (Cro superfamily)